MYDTVPIFFIWFTFLRATPHLWNLRVKDKNLLFSWSLLWASVLLSESHMAVWHCYLFFHPCTVPKFLFTCIVWSLNALGASLLRDDRCVGWLSGGKYLLSAESSEFTSAHLESACILYVCLQDLFSGITAMKANHGQALNLHFCGEDSSVFSGEILSKIDIVM